MYKVMTKTFLFFPNILRIYPHIYQYAHPLPTFANIQSNCAGPQLHAHTSFSHLVSLPVDFSNEKINWQIWPLQHEKIDNFAPNLAEKLRRPV